MVGQGAGGRRAQQPAQPLPGPGPTGGLALASCPIPCRTAVLGCPQRFSVSNAPSGLLWPAAPATSGMGQTAPYSFKVHSFDDVKPNPPAVS